MRRALFALLLLTGCTDACRHDFACQLRWYGGPICEAHPGCECVAAGPDTCRQVESCPKGAGIAEPDAVPPGGGVASR